MEPVLLKITEAARVLGLSRATLYRLVAAGRLRVVHIGRATRVPAQELQRFLAEIGAGAPEEHHGQRIAR